MRKKKECEGQMELDLVDQKNEKSSTGTKPKRKRVVKKEKDTDKETVSVAKRTKTKIIKESAVSKKKETVKKTTKKVRPEEQGTVSSGTTRKPRRKKTAETSLSEEDRQKLMEEIESKGYAGIGLIMRTLHTSANNAIEYLAILKKDHIVDDKNQLVNKKE